MLLVSIFETTFHDCFCFVVVELTEKLTDSFVGVFCVNCNHWQGKTTKNVILPSIFFVQFYVLMIQYIVC